ncbi:DUF4129 domain-containing protein [Nostoc parmelioides]|uniref:DUF4129 domain-containing protein n=1 Tax=Nostoc parmelioides FACHB-3921 TaxID=2692909 RepID=A0ABR8BIW9_9NOSO|nr:DUF4129 domain-containing protein [Nostoc parmelioides]MBD2253072.1 DUF4129 domain-containing protein [Nostoc parmelioides FACHB-3921]
MSIDTFEKSSLNWQVSQFQQQVGEWLEYQSYRFEQILPNLSPGWKLAPWVINLLSVLSWSLLVLFLIVVIWRLWVAFSPYVFSWLNNRGYAQNEAKRPTPDLSVANLLERSQVLYRQSDYREACRCLYLAILQHLHDSKIILHKPSRTDSEYLQLLRLSATPVQPYETVITTHEQLCFGNAEILPENYEQCRQAYREIVQQ